MYNNVTIEQFEYLDNEDCVNSGGYAVTGVNISIDFKKELWFDMGKSMWRKYLYVSQGHVKYNRNDILNLFRTVIVQYAERVCEIHDINKFMPPSSKKGDEYDQADWTVRNIHVVTKDGLPSSMQDYRGDKYKDY